jgi:hypothetical protein
MRTLGLGLLLILLLATPAHAQLAAAVLPSVRSVQVGYPATAFATIINAGAETAFGCSIEPATNVPATFLYQTTDQHTNQITGTPNTPVNIPPGGSQTFLIALTPITTMFPPVIIAFRFTCTNTSAADVIPFVNTLWMNAGDSPLPDIIPIAVTPTNDGVVNIPSGGKGVMALAAMNIGASEPPAGCPDGVSCTCSVFVTPVTTVSSLNVGDMRHKSAHGRVPVCATSAARPIPRCERDGHVHCVRAVVRPRGVRPWRESHQCPLH